MRVRSIPSFLALLAVLAAAPAPARADDDDIGDDVPVVTMGFAERGKDLVVERLALGPLLFDERAYEKLAKNPLATVVVVRFYVYQEGQREPVAYRLMTMRIVYDLWLEEYEVRIDSERGRKGGRFARLSQAYAAITELDRLPIAPLSGIAVGPRYHLGLVAELNPVSQATMAEVRRWLTRPAGPASLDRDSSFFGSFVSIFVNARLPEADRVIRMRTQPFYRVPR